MKDNRLKIYVLVVVVVLIGISVQVVAAPFAEELKIFVTPTVLTTPSPIAPTAVPNNKPVQTKKLTLKVQGKKSAQVVVSFVKTKHAVKYEIYRKTLSVAGKKVKKNFTLQKITTTTRWTDKQVECGNTYSYKVRAISEGGQKGKYSTKRKVSVILGYSKKQLALIKKLITKKGTDAGKFTYTNKELALLGEEVLINKHNYINKGFNGFDIVPATGLQLAPERPRQRVSKLALKQMRKMFNAAKKEGITLWVYDIYRTRAYQTAAHNNKVNYFKSFGYSDKIAREKASTITAIPNTSEHQSGLAIDIISPNARVRNSTFALSETGKWLEKNSWEYGFNLRYMKNKTQRTEIIFEPWHYRYVGKPLARLLKEEKICLEEYYHNIEKYNAKYAKYKN